MATFEVLILGYFLSLSRGLMKRVWRVAKRPISIWWTWLARNGKSTQKLLVCVWKKREVSTSRYLPSEMWSRSPMLPSSCFMSVFYKPLPTSVQMKLCGCGLFSKFFRVGLYQAVSWSCQSFHFPNQTSVSHPVPLPFLRLWLTMAKRNRVTSRIETQSSRTFSRSVTAPPPCIHKKSSLLPSLTNPCLGERWLFQM